MYVFIRHTHTIAGHIEANTTADGSVVVQTSAQFLKSFMILNNIAPGESPQIWIGVLPLKLDSGSLKRGEALKGAIQI